MLKGVKRRNISLSKERHAEFISGSPNILFVLQDSSLRSE